MAEKYFADTGKKLTVVSAYRSYEYISDTDKGEEILDKINDLRQLLEAYKAGLIK